MEKKFLGLEHKYSSLGLFIFYLLLLIFNNSDFWETDTCIRIGCLIVNQDAAIFFTIILFVITAYYWLEE